jgi:hypothetical protein
MLIKVSLKEVIRTTNVPKQMHWENGDGLALKLMETLKSVYAKH